MSVFIAKHTEIGLKFSWRVEPLFYSNTPYWLDFPVDVDFRLLAEKLQEDVEVVSNPRKRQRLSPPLLESFRLLFSRYCSSVTVTAFGPALQLFIADHKNKKLRMIFHAKFDKGFSIYCEMSPNLDTRPKMFESETRNWFFEGSVNIDSNEVFKTDQLYTCKYSLEILDQNAFTYGNLNDAKPKLKEVLEEGKYSDFAIIADGNVRIPCHKLILGVQSPVLDRMLQMECKEMAENCVKMEASANGANAFLKFIYHGDLGDAFGSPTIAVELLKLAHVYDVKTLEAALKILFVKRADEWLDVDAALNLLLFANGKDGMESLMEKALKIIKTRKDELNESPVFQDILKGDADEVTEFFKLLL